MENKKIRLGVVGLGHRGRLMFQLAGEKFARKMLKKRVIWFTI